MKRSPLKRKARLKPRSDKPSRRAAEAALEEAKVEAREKFGHACTVHPNRTGWHLHHGLPRSTHPFLRAAAENLIPLCRACHAWADRPDHWLHWACREVAEERLAARNGKRPYPSDLEIEAILARHQFDAERPHVSPLGRTD